MNFFWIKLFKLPFLQPTNSFVSDLEATPSGGRPLSLIQGHAPVYQIQRDLILPCTSITRTIISRYIDFCFFFHLPSSKNLRTDHHAASSASSYCSSSSALRNKFLTCSTLPSSVISLPSLQQLRISEHTFFLKKILKKELGCEAQALLRS